jgi:GT2 family glycosyltransferase
VIIPTKDRLELLMRTLSSATGQQGVDVQVIVVDDGSVDGTDEYLSGISDPRVQSVRHQRSCGVAAARNAGLRLASGKWITFVDDDDLLAPRKLSLQIQAASEADLVLCGWYVIDARGGVRGTLPAPSVSKLEVDLLAPLPVGPPACALLRTECVRAAGGFDETFSMLADWDLWLRVVHGGVRAAVVEQPLVAARVHAGSMQMRDTRAWSRELRLLRRKHRQLASGHGTRIGGPDLERWIASCERFGGRRVRSAARYLWLAGSTRSSADLRDSYRALRTAPFDDNALAPDGPPGPCWVEELA